MVVGCILLVAGSLVNLNLLSFDIALEFDVT